MKKVKKNGFILLVLAALTSLHLPVSLASSFQEEYQRIEEILGGDLDGQINLIQVQKIVAENLK